MSEQSFEEMLDETFKTIHTGEVVDGTVIDVRKTRSSLTSAIRQMVLLHVMNTHLHRALT